MGLPKVPNSAHIYSNQRGGLKSTRQGLLLDKSKTYRVNHPSFVIFILLFFSFERTLLWNAYYYGEAIVTYPLSHVIWKLFENLKTHNQIYTRMDAWQDGSSRVANDAFLLHFCFCFVDGSLEALPWEPCVRAVLMLIFWMSSREWNPTCTGTKKSKLQGLLVGLPVVVLPIVWLPCCCLHQTGPCVLAQYRSFVLSLGLARYEIITRIPHRCGFSLSFSLSLSFSFSFMWYYCRWRE
jgi:hypothetical protein